MSVRAACPYCLALLRHRKSKSEGRILALANMTPPGFVFSDDRVFWRALESVRFLPPYSELTAGCFCSTALRPAAMHATEAARLTYQARLVALGAERPELCGRHETGERRGFLGAAQGFSNEEPCFHHVPFDDVADRCHQRTDVTPVRPLAAARVEDLLQLLGHERDPPPRRNTALIMRVSSIVVPSVESMFISITLPFSTAPGFHLFSAAPALAHGPDKGGAAQPRRERSWRTLVWVAVRHTPLTVRPSTQPREGRYPHLAQPCWLAAFVERLFALSTNPTLCSPPAGRR
jgi:hypothetical protein